MHSWLAFTTKQTEVRPTGQLDLKHTNNTKHVSDRKEAQHKDKCGSAGSPAIPEQDNGGEEQKVKVTLQYTANMTPTWATENKIRGQPDISFNPSTWEEEPDGSL